MVAGNVLQVAGCVLWIMGNEVAILGLVSVKLGMMTGMSPVEPLIVGMEAAILRMASSNVRSKVVMWPNEAAKVS